MGGLCARELQGKLIVRVRTTDEDISDESFTTKAEILINLMTKKIATPNNLKSTD
jgi:hypothetical protein